MELPPIIDEEMRGYFKDNYNREDTDSLERVLIELKANGYSQMQGVFLLIEQLHFPFIQANRIILNSKAWN